MTSTQAKGAAAEDLAARYLAERGLRVVERNFRVRGGELDLICLDGEAVVFVEVRLRRSANFGGAAASITATKQARVIMAARHWLARHGRYNDRPCRFDCVLMDGDIGNLGNRGDQSDHIEWLRDAFSAD
jgi:putative endonuclease